MAGGPGSGGIDHGRGDAEMIWGKEAAGDPSKFKTETLPAAKFADPEHTAVAGIGAAAPNVEPIAEHGGAASGAVSTGKSAWRRRLAPHHREAVKTFFTRDAPAKQ